MPELNQITTVFFDLGATLVDPVLTSEGKFSGFTVLPGTAAGLQRLADAKLRLGIISNTGEIAGAKIRSACSRSSSPTGTSPWPRRQFAVSSAMSRRNVEQHGGAGCGRARHWIGC
jgi:hypothetical protein